MDQREPQTIKARSYVIEGRVQGVGFRAFVCRQADQLGVTGEVWNRSDGFVEAHAEHLDESVLDRFESLLQRGPGRVDRVISQSAAARGFSRFSVGSTR